MTGFVPESSLLDEHLREVREDVPFAHIASIPSLDRLVSGYKSKSLTFLSGAPGTGKTTFAVHMADDLAMQGVPVLFVERELAAAQLVAKSLARLCDGALSVSEISTVNQGEGPIARAIEIYRERVAPCLCINTTVKSPVEIGAAVSDCQKVTGRTPVVFVDYLQILDGDNARAYQDERLAIKDTVLGLRSVANTYGVHVIGISTINRTSYGKPTVDLSSLGGCSFIEYSADVCIHLTVDGKGKEQAANLASSVRPVTVTALKNRFGQTGSVPLMFDTAHARFLER